ncbi:MAG: DUF4407 domain-containing protein [Acidobacteriota bacterium]
MSNHPVSSFLFYCAGSDEQTLEHCSRWERFRHATVGTFVVLTSLLALFSSGYALSTVFENDLRAALCAAALWAFLIFTLDRFIVMSMAETGLRRVAHAIPRILLAGFIALIVARPLELRIFEQEILAAIAGQRQAEIESAQDSFRDKIKAIDTALQQRLDSYEVARAVDSLNARIATLDTALVTCRASEQEAARAFHAEVDGSGGSGRPGYGTLAKTKEATLRSVRGQCAAQRTELKEERGKRDTLQVTASQESGQWRQAAEAEKADLLQQHNTHLGQLTEGYPTSFLQRHLALSQLEEREPAIRQAVLFITLLFLLIECSPVISKLLSSNGFYEQLLRDRKGDEALELVRRDSHRKIDQDKIQLEAEIQQDLVGESRTILREKGKQVVEQWKTEGLEPATLLQKLHEQAEGILLSAFSRKETSTPAPAKTVASAPGSETLNEAWAVKPSQPAVEGGISGRLTVMATGISLITFTTFYLWNWTHRYEIAIAAGSLVALTIKHATDFWHQSRRGESR